MADRTDRRDASGVGRRASWARRALVMAPLLAGAIAACAPVNPVTGRRPPITMGPAEIAELGALAHVSLVERFGLADRPVLLAEVARIGGALAAVSEAPDLDWRFHILADPSVNAFAGPAGALYVTEGLLAFADSEADIAAILAHEIAHVTAQHFLDGVAGLGALRRRVSDRDGETPTAAERLALDAAAATSQRNEIEADALSLRYLEAAGYAPDVALAFLRDVTTLQALEAAAVALEGAPEGEGPRGAAPPVFRSHPLSDVRLAAAETALMAFRSLAGSDVGADAAQDEAEAAEARARFLPLLDGAPFGPQDDAGVVRGGVYGWPSAAIQVAAPEGVTLFAQPQGFIGRAATGVALLGQIDLDGRFSSAGAALDDLRLILAELGLPAGFDRDEAVVQAGAFPGLRLDPSPVAAPGGRAIGLMALSTPEGLLRLTLVGEPEVEPAVVTGLLDALIAGTAPLQGDAAARFGPLQIAVRPLARRETLATLAKERATLFFDPSQAEARIRLLNGLGPDAAPPVGTLVKLPEPAPESANPEAPRRAAPSAFAVRPPRASEP